MINRFTGNGIFNTNGGGNTIVGNCIGTDIGGTIDRGNALSGVFIEQLGQQRRRRLNAADRNVIAGNSSTASRSMARQRRVT